MSLINACPPSTQSDSSDEFLEDANDKKLYKCSVCSMKFTRYCSLKGHLSSHKISPGSEPDENNLLSAEKSNQSFKPVSPEEPIIMKDGLYTCALCKKEFEVLRSIRFHITSSHPDAAGMYRCHRCRRNFVRLKALNMHNLRYHNKDQSHGKSVFPCDFCEQTFNNKKRQTKHIQYHKEQQCMQELLSDSYLSDTSEEEATTEVAEKNPTPEVGVSGRERGGSKRFACSFCDKSFHSVYARSAHSKVHIRQSRQAHNTFGPPKKSVRTPDQRELAKTQKNVSSSGSSGSTSSSLELQSAQDESCLCEFCGELFTSQLSLKQHLNMRCQSSENAESEPSAEINNAIEPSQLHTSRPTSEGEDIEPHGMVDEVNGVMIFLKQEPRESEDGSDGDNELVTRRFDKSLMFSREELMKFFHVCNCCNKKFEFEVDMIDHENQPEKILYSCKHCNVHFADSDAVEVHEKIHITHTEIDID